MVWRTLAVLLTVNLAGRCLAAEAAHHEAAPAGDAAHAPASHAPSAHAQIEPHPILPKDSSWARPVVIGALGLFAAAIPIGILVRANMPEDVPVESHDEHGPVEHKEADTHGAPPGHGHH